jgi:phosphoglucomutase
MPTTLQLSADAAAKLLPSTQQNIARVYASPETTAIDRASIDELLASGAWTELDDRFYRDIAFGTGGMRGRTIGKVVTKTEKGQPQPLDRPEFPGVGTNMLNYGNVQRNSRRRRRRRSTRSASTRCFLPRIAPRRNSPTRFAPPPRTPAS